MPVNPRNMPLYQFSGFNFCLHWHELKCLDALSINFTNYLAHATDETFLSDTSVCKTDPGRLSRIVSDFMGVNVTVPSTQGKQLFVGSGLDISILRTVLLCVIFLISLQSACTILECYTLNISPSTCGLLGPSSSHTAVWPNKLDQLIHRRQTRSSFSLQ